MASTATAAPDGPPRPTRERILDAALDLFNEQGYDATSLREIAEVMGFTKAALYYHFASKDELLLGLHLRLHAVAEELFARMEGGLPSGLEEWRDLLADLVDELFKERKLLLFHQRNHSAVERALHDIHHHDDASTDLEEAFRRAVSDAEVPLRDRVRIAAGIGAIYGAVAQLGDVMGDVGEQALAVELRAALTDLLAPAGS